MTSCLQTQLITDFAGLLEIEASWWHLLERLPAATPFSTPAWLIPWWQAFWPGQLSIVAIRRAGTLVGLAPLYIETKPAARRLLPVGIGVSDYMDVLLDPDCPEAGSALFEALAEFQSEWDFWSAEQASAEATVLHLPEPAGWTSHARPQNACPVLSLGPSPLEAIPLRQQRKWRMAKNRTARRNFSLRTTSPETLEPDLAHLFGLHAARWQDRGEPGVLEHPVVQQFHGLAAPRLLEAGLLRMSLLCIDGEVAGVYYGLQRGRSAYAYLGGFDPAFGFESPGTVLLGAAIEDAAAQGVEAFHLLRGQEDYKYAWGAVDRWNQIRIFQPAS